MQNNNGPINREVITASTPLLRVLLGLVFISLSAGSTIYYAASDLVRFFGLGQTVTIYLINDCFYFATVIAIIIFVGEVVTGNISLKAYIPFLIPDIVYTCRGIQTGIGKMFVAAVGDEPAGQVIALGLSWIVSIAIAIAVAYYGEILLFGPRKKGGRK